MWIEKRGDKIYALERYIDLMTGKRKRTSVSISKDTKREREKARLVYGNDLIFRSRKSHHYISHSCCGYKYMLNHASLWAEYRLFKPSVVRMRVNA